MKVLVKGKYSIMAGKKVKMYAKNTIVEEKEDGYDIEWYTYNTKKDEEFTGKFFLPKAAVLNDKEKYFEVNPEDSSISDVEEIVTLMDPKEYESKVEHSAESK